MAVNIRPLPQSEPAAARLYLREEELDRALALMFDATRRFWRSAEPALEEAGLGPAHYRALAAIRREPDLAVGALQERLGVRKQSLARVLDELEQQGMITRAPGVADRRERRLSLTEQGRAAEALVTARLRERLAAVFRAAGAEAVLGARTVWTALAEEDGGEA